MDKHEAETGLSFERVVFFTDAVFAIVITPLAPIAFAFIPLFARVLDTRARRATDYTDVMESA